MKIESLEEFNKEYLGNVNLDYFRLALECWEKYDSQADSVPSPARLFQEIASNSLIEAKEKGFKGNLQEWRAEIKESGRFSKNG